MSKLLTLNQQKKKKETNQINNAEIKRKIEIIRKRKKL